MTGTFLICVLLNIGGTPASASGTKPSAPPRVIRIAADVMPEPQPALRYRLLPELHDMQPGNPILGYMKCFMEQERFFFNQESVAQRDRFAKMPLQELRSQNLQDYWGAALRQADFAARLQTPDWQTLIPLRQAGVGLLIPEVQRLRMLSAALIVRFRGQVAMGHYDDALRTAQTMFALGRHLSEHPTLIGNLVGLAIAFYALDALDEMLGQPHCPNLYWALTDLPSPIVGLQRGIEGDRVMFGYEFSWLDEKSPMDAEKLEKAYNRFQLLLASNSTDGQKKCPSVRAYVEERIKDSNAVNAARQRLVAAGLTADAVQNFPAAQVVLLDEKRAEYAFGDQLSRIMQLPYWQADAFLRRRPLPETGKSLFGGLEAAMWKIRQVQARQEQRIALLRIVEALRLYAAEHKGKLPQSLDELVVPVPVDPVTGRPFPYRLDGETASVEGTPPLQRASEPGWHVRYELTIRK